MEELYKNEFCRTIKQKSIVYFGHWMPTNEMSLGDYGIMNGNSFIKYGNIIELGIDFEISQVETISSKNYFSEDSVEYIPEDGVFNIKNYSRASLNITFAREGNFFFNLSGCKLKYIINKLSLKIPIIELINQQKMSWNYVVITDIIECDKLFFLVANAENAYSRILSSSRTDKKIRFSDPNQEWMINEISKIGYSLQNTRNTTPLFGICGFKPNWKIHKKIVPIMIKNSKFLTSYIMTINALKNYAVNNIYNINEIEIIGNKYKRKVVDYTHIDYLRNDLKEGITFRYNYPYDKKNRLEAVYDENLIEFPQLIEKNSKLLKDKLYKSLENEYEFVSFNLEYDYTSDFVQII